MKKVIITLVTILGISSISHALVMPQATRCMLIDLYDFEKEGQVYFRPHIEEEKREEIHQLITQAEHRVNEFWRGRRGTPKYIYTESNEEYIKFGAPFPTPAAAVMHFGSYVVINHNGVDLDIISHELSHVELFARIGLINRSLDIPVWFDEGLAMQVDHRSYYSIDTLQILSNNFQHLPDVQKMQDYGTFGSGTPEEIMMNYRTSKYVISKWYTPQKLEALIEKLNDGKSFEESY